MIFPTEIPEYPFYCIGSTGRAILLRHQEATIREQEVTKQATLLKHETSK